MSRNIYIKAKQSGGIIPDEWVRPSDWLPMPELSENDDKFIALHAVVPNALNFVSMFVRTTIGTFTVDWGDGNIIVYNSGQNGLLVQHEYNFNLIPNSTLTSRGYKQVIIQITPNEGEIRRFRLGDLYVSTPGQSTSNPYSSNFLDMKMSFPNMEFNHLILGGVNPFARITHRMCERVEIKNLGNEIILFRLFEEFSSLQKIILPNTANCIDFRAFYGNNSSLKTPPLIDLSSAIDLTSFHANNYSLKVSPFYNTQNGQNFESMFLNNHNLLLLPLYNTSNATNMFSMVQNCWNLRHIPALSTASMPVTATAPNFGNWSGNRSLNRIEVSFTRTVNLSNNQLSREALLEVFTNLADRTGFPSANITITGNWGATALTTADRAIATSKNWTITG